MAHSGDFWAKKWNLQVNTTLRRSFFNPIRKHLGVSSAVAALATFVCSGIFHEFQFKLSFPNYTVGSATWFFFLQGAFAFVDTLYSKMFGQFGLMTLGAPACVQSFGVMALLSPSMPYFSQIWIDQGMFDLFSRMSPQWIMN